MFFSMLNCGLKNRNGEPTVRIRYNAPVTLTFALAAAFVLLFDTMTGAGITPALFTALPKGFFNFSDPLAYFRLVSHVIGHGSWEHLLSNFAIILLIGPNSGRKIRLRPAAVDDFLYRPCNGTGKHLLFPYSPFWEPRA